jgi:hypothetical protein
MAETQTHNWPDLSIDLYHNLTGRLAGSFDGRPVVIEADDAGLLLTAVTFRAAWSMRRLAHAMFPLLFSSCCGMPASRCGSMWRAWLW